MTTEPVNSGATPIPPAQMPAKPKRKPKLATLAPTHADLMAQAKGGAEHPTLDFLNDIFGRLKGSVTKEMGEIETAWLQMHTRYIELLTILQAIDAGVAVADTPRLALDARLENPGGSVDNDDLQHLIEGIRDNTAKLQVHAPTQAS